MDRLQRWFGLGKANSLESISATGSDVSTGKQDQTSSSSLATDATRTKHADDKMLEKNAAPQQQLGSEYPSSPSFAREPETRVGQLLYQAREVILHVVPLREGDCLSCKLIGCGAMWGAAIFVLLSYPKVRARYSGFQRKLVVFQVGSLATTLTLLGAARFFDLSVFSPPDKEGKRKSLGEMVTEDLDNVYKYSSKILSPSSDTASDSKKGS